MRSEHGGVSQVCLCRRTHTHTCAWQPQALSSLAWRREGACGHTHTYTLVHTQIYIAAECCAGGALTSYRMCACLRTALISARCTATAAQRPQCGCDTCQGERGRKRGGGGGCRKREREQESWQKKQRQQDNFSEDRLVIWLSSLF